MPGTAADPGRSIPRRLYDHLGAIGLVYLGICAALLVWAWAVTVTDNSDESMAGVIPFLATAPVSFVFLMLPANGVVFVIAIVVGAAVDATVIGWCARTLRRGGRPDH
ncbi:SCO4225 family membrane protein [Streptomyces cyaneofuscatus]|uniref:SCO4225 family membrane protein n=1 Tax=Streptomyces cyaneofuscatus TaxID=66883 RepID=UPI00364F30B3